MLASASASASTAWSTAVKASGGIMALFEAVLAEAKPDYIVLHSDLVGATNQRECRDYFEEYIQKGTVGAWYCVDFTTLEGMHGKGSRVKGPCTCIAKEDGTLRHSWSSALTLVALSGCCPGSVPALPRLCRVLLGRDGRPA